MKKHESVSFVDRLLADLGQVLGNSVILPWLELEVCELFGLADQLNDVFEFHVFVDFLDIGCQGLHFDVVIAADDTQVGGVELVLLFFIVFNAFYVGQVLSCFIDQVRKIKTDALFVGLIHVIKVRVADEASIHEGPGQPVNSFALARNGLCNDCRVEVVVEMEMKGRFQREGLKEELFIEFFFGALTIYHKLGCTELSSFLPVPLKDRRQTHELSHLWDRIVIPPSVFGVIVSCVKKSHHKYLIVDLPLEPMSNYQDADPLNFEKFFNNLSLEFIHSLVNVADSVLDDVQQKLIRNTLGNIL